MGGEKNRSIVILLFCLCLFIGLGTSLAKAGLDVRIAYIKLQEIVNGYEKYKELGTKAELDNELDRQMFNERKKEIEDEIERLKSELEMQGLMFSESAKEEKQAEIEGKVEELDELSKYFNRRYEERMAKFEKEVFEDLESNLPPIIESIAEKEGYRFVFDTRLLLYWTPEEEFDLTDKVLARLNEEYRTKTESGE